MKIHVYIYTYQYLHDWFVVTCRHTWCIMMYISVHARIYTHINVRIYCTNRYTYNFFGVRWYTFQYTHVYIHITYVLQVYDACWIFWCKIIRISVYLYVLMYIWIDIHVLIFQIDMFVLMYWCLHVLMHAYCICMDICVLDIYVSTSWCIYV